ncbi:hypothetical protein JSR02_00115 [Candidatus Vidania fulgoroideae]|uniref:Uncharacterized protein n=1 Tax=Candidatus Vidania fulgoroideorum TaxID=881286 RepID=A0A974X783_9PROT|nr:hypothetical protein JSR02_00115 [Candidatus Vidania fulgoroideae]
MIKIFIRDQLIHNTKVIAGILQYDNKRLPILIENTIETQLQKKKSVIQIQLHNTHLHTYIENYSREILNNKLKNIILTHSHTPRKYIIKTRYSNYKQSDLFKNTKKSIYSNIKSLKINSLTTTQTPSYIQLNTLKIKTPIKIKHLKTLRHKIKNFKNIKNTPLFTF